jgi:hypothetical protein
LLLGLLLALGTFVGCGGDDDDDSSDDDDNDTDDDTDDDDTDDDDTDDDDDTEYTKLACPTPDPEGINEGDEDNLVGGGPISDTITVYVYNDADCTPIEGASVIAGGEPILTDADGKAVITITKAASLVTAYKETFWAWSYKADAAVMYFRLRPADYGRGYVDTPGAQFTMSGAPLALENPSVNGLGGVIGLLSDQIYAGVAFPGIARTTALSMDFEKGFLATSTFDFTINGEATELPTNLYIPAFSFDAFDQVINGENETFQFPIVEGETSPYEGIVLELSVGDVISDTDALLALIDVLINGGDIMDAILPLVPTMINGGLEFKYVGNDPDWDGAGTPDLEVVETSNQFTLTITGADSSYDYLGILAAEVPNRSLLPMGLCLVQSGQCNLKFAEIPGAKYVLFLGETDLLTSNFESVNLNFALKYFNSTADFAGGVSVAASDFLSLFDGENTGYDTTTGEVSWTLESKADPDLYLVVYVPTCDGCPVTLATVPGADNSYQPPIDALGITPSDDPEDPDIVVVAGVNLPDGTDVNEFNPHGLLGYNSAALNLWTNYDILSLFGDL